MDEFSENTVAEPRQPSIDANEVAKFSAMAAEWWDPKGKFKPLHKFNPVRLGFIRDTACSHFGLDGTARKPLKGLRVLDIGCGGGLVSEPMARLGASVTGVDASEANIKTALTHAREGGLDIDYRAGTAEGLLEAGVEPFDIVLNLEVVEHVADPAQFMKDTAALLRPGGLMIAATLNRTPKAFALAIVGAEYVLRWLPPGTHEFSKFLTPAEVAAPLQMAGLETDRPQGVSYNPVSDSWRLSNDTKVNYMLVARRPVSPGGG
ncbi:bifunctional 2-polyprenyl-6-hydroxyphenol methylase/3-demethylubiquinol 3-O-methyltransferase UbiG [Henriciella barbarensis]|uniref:Ubiquinone biosynthesis O-methyltransferase n=1 Tax=Henriciella barbarensis TaxID=86342 RepID=A0A399QXJ3_9PROT|nr:bifunctional 2-polyprenyl-6-hydroxyphenol methylase/3-demethylubiquinol 3-O-methyltransferase UbiG [Henriciella barbarensis]RIJ23660.1 bifunctional 2-polyprenyl-6-hydroxyphenol methylase/3-demethylubiquinol 3-O-methyltransferase UbiG [Henriciella barbarensis]